MLSLIKLTPRSFLATALAKSLLRVGSAVRHQDQLDILLMPKSGHVRVQSLGRRSRQVANAVTLSSPKT